MFGESVRGKELGGGHKVFLKRTCKNHKEGKGGSKMIHYRRFRNA
jgi:hypothetical protein